jgi:hypothetical protein
MDEPFRTNKLVPVAKPQGDTLASEAFHPLMHSLLTFGLVTRVEGEDGTHHWRLIDAAEKRLDQLSASLNRPRSALAYLDHWCASCREQRLTHLVDGRYLCPDCERLEGDPQVEPTERPPRRGVRVLRPRKS